MARGTKRQKWWPQEFRWGLGTGVMLCEGAVEAGPFELLGGVEMGEESGLAGGGWRVVVGC